MNRNVIIVIVLVVLVLLTAVQAMQLNSLKTSLGSGLATGKINVGNPAAQSTGQGISSGIDDLPPAMVGGC